MANQALVQYIREQVKAGYDINTIKSHLVKHGYSNQDVNAAAGATYRPDVSHVVHHLSKNTIAAIAVLIIILAVAVPSVYFYMSSQDGPAQLLDLSTSSIKESVEKGDTLEFNIELSNLGRAKRYDVFLKHELIGTSVEKEETIAVETSTSKKSSIDLPESLIAKRYTLKTTATYGDNKKAFSTFGFNILKREGDDEGNIESCTEDWKCDVWKPSNCPSSGEQTRTCTEENKCGTAIYKPETKRTCSYKEEEEPPKRDVVTKDFADMTVWEKLDAIKEIAITDPTQASAQCVLFDIESHKDECYFNVAESTESIGMCEKIISERTKDKCLNNVAKITSNNELCEEIIKITRKDSCYMNFVNSGDYTVCDRIDNSYLKEACEALKDMPDVVVS